jgi:hypothetical protein
MRTLHPADGIVAFYDGRVEGYRFAEELNWVDDGALGLGIASYAIVDGDPAAIAAAIGRGDGFDRELARFAKAYAAQNEADHAALVAAVESGRVPAQSGL